MRYGAHLPPPGLPGLDPGWSRLVTVADDDGVPRTWHVLDNGVAEPQITLLCLHGNPTWSYLWRRLLAGVPPSWRVVAPDQLGMGFSERLDAPRRLRRRVSDLGRLTDALELTGPVVTVAHDWGGPISLGWALQHRTQLRGLVLTNTAVQLPDGLAGPVLIRLARSAPLRRTVCLRTPTFVRAATALCRPPLAPDVRAAFSAPYVGPDRRRSVADFVSDIPLEPDHPSRQALEEIAAGIRGLDVPALVLWGPRDPVFTQPYLDDLLERMPQAQLHRYELASHLLPEDAPEYAATIVHWLTDLAKTGALQHKTGARPTTALDRGVRPARPTALWDRLTARADDPRPAVVHVGGAAVSWRLLERRVREIAAGLAAAHVKPGDRVALLVPPSVDLTAAVYAVWRAGGVVVVADKGLGPVGMKRALRSAGVDHVIATAAGLAAARALGLPGTRITAGTAPRLVHRALGSRLSSSELARAGRTAPEPGPPAADDECAVVFTSGATGPAKGVVYRHRQVQTQLELVRSTYALGEEDRMVAAFAPFALYGPALGIGSAVPDMDVTAPGTLSAAALAAAVDAVAATVVFASPAALRGVLSTAATLTSAHRSALRGVRLVISAGAPVPVELLRSVHALVPTAEIHTPYGMTEVLPVTDISLPQIEEAGRGNGVCVGSSLPGVDVAVSPLSASGVPHDGVLTTEPDVTGEVCVRADHVKDRYDGLWATERAASRIAGWHRTGDVGHLDLQDRLWVEGRLDHLIVTATGAVTPVGIEQRVQSLDAVASAAAVGVGPVGAQQVVLVTVPQGRRPPRWSSPVAPQDLTDAVRGAAGVDVAAVLVARTLPVDVRHASKVDRSAVAGWASHVLAGTRP
ncbi:MAG: alpha/beta fold hydrolase [Actinomycetota bacterium]|nr:alpha/beta fold hydrolase [Actinomycetota bacterium]